MESEGRLCVTVPDGALLWLDYAGQTSFSDQPVTPLAAVLHTGNASIKPGLSLPGAIKKGVTQMGDAFLHRLVQEGMSITT
jgi:hypothetical protein